MIALTMEAVSISETSVNFYQTIRRNNLEDSRLHTRRRKNLKNHYGTFIPLIPPCVAQWAHDLGRPECWGCEFIEALSALLGLIVRPTACRKEDLENL
jgi:hypothetical protein